VVTWVKCIVSTPCIEVESPTTAKHTSTHASFSFAVQSCHQARASVLAYLCLAYTHATDNMHRLCTDPCDALRLLIGVWLLTECVAHLQALAKADSPRSDSTAPARDTEDTSSPKQVHSCLFHLLLHQQLSALQHHLVDLYEHACCCSLERVWCYEFNHIEAASFTILWAHILPPICGVIICLHWWAHLCPFPGAHLLLAHRSKLLLAFQRSLGFINRVRSVSLNTANSACNPF